MWFNYLKAFATMLMSNDILHQKLISEWDMKHKGLFVSELSFNFIHSVHIIIIKKNICGQNAWWNLIYQPITLFSSLSIIKVCVPKLFFSAFVVLKTLSFRIYSFFSLILFRRRRMLGGDGHGSRRQQPGQQRRGEHVVILFLSHRVFFLQKVHLMK